MPPIRPNGCLHKCCTSDPTTKHNIHIHTWDTATSSTIDLFGSADGSFWRRRRLAFAFGAERKIYPQTGITHINALITMCVILMSVKRDAGQSSTVIALVVYVALCEKDYRISAYFANNFWFEAFIVTSSQVLHLTHIFTIDTFCVFQHRTLS